MDHASPLRIIEVTSIDTPMPSEEPEQTVRTPGELFAALRTAFALAFVLGAGSYLWMRAAVKHELQPADVGIFLVCLVWASGIFEKLRETRAAAEERKKLAEETNVAAKTAVVASDESRRTATEIKEIAKQTKDTIDKAITTLNDQSTTLSSVKSFLQTMLKEPEIAHLRILQETPEIIYTSRWNLQQELKRLRELGFIGERPERAVTIETLPEYFVIGEYFELTKEGTDFLDMHASRKELLEL
jgi:hypothetical protein